MRGHWAPTHNLPVYLLRVLGEEGWVHQVSGYCHLAGMYNRVGLPECVYGYARVHA